MNPVNAQEYIQQHQPRRWSRSTVADGKWMQDKTFTPLTGNDEQLGIYIDQIVEGLNAEITDREQADAAEAAARLAYDGILSGRCDFLYTSAQQIRQDLTKESEDRVDGDEATLNAAKSYTDTASGNLDKRIDGVSGAFSSFRDTINTWKDTKVNPTLDVYSACIDILQGKTDQLSIDIKTSADKVREEFALADGVLQDQIDALTNATDVIDVVGTTAGLNPYSGFITSGDVIKVLSGTDGKQEYFKWTAAKSATSAPFSEFSLVGSLEPYYTMAQIDDKFTNYYNTSQIDDKLQYKVGVNAQSFTTAQQLQARTNIGASDGTIQWVGPDGTMNAPIKVVSAEGGIHIEDVHENAQATYKFFIAPEATTDDYAKFFGVYQGEHGPAAGWLSPFPAKSSTDVGKALVVDTDVGLKWEDLGKGVHYVNLRSEKVTTATYDEIRAALEAGKQVIGYVSADSGYNAFAVYACQGWNADQMAFVNSHQGSINEIGVTKNNANISYKNSTYLIDGTQSLSHKDEVRANIEVAKGPLIFTISNNTTRTLTTDEMNEFMNAISPTNTSHREVYIMTGFGSNSRWYRFTSQTGGSVYIFSSVNEQSISYISLVAATRVATVHTALQVLNQTPATYEQGTIYIV